MYRLRVSKRGAEVEILDALTWSPVHAATAATMTPLEWKLVDGDEFSWTQQQLTLVTPSPKRTATMPAVLVLEDNKTYGRVGRKLLYRCLPNDTSLPAFLVPYEIKVLGFCKVLANLYVTITFDHWRDKHPCGKLTEVLGPVEDMNAFAEYQILCKGLQRPMQPFYHEVVRALAGQDANTLVANLCLKHNIPWSPDLSVCSIDPEGCQDFDDALSTHFDAASGLVSVGVYIANVAVILDALQLWESFAGRVATIYLPTRKIPMLPTKLSEDVCSLRAHKSSMVLRMSVVFDPCSGEVHSVEFSALAVRIRKNFVYESPELLASSWYANSLLPWTRAVCAKRPLVGCPAIADSHDVVAYWMLFMNCEVAKRLAAAGSGVFRSCQVDGASHHADPIPVGDPAVRQFLQLYRRVSSAYVRDAPQAHDLLQLDAYVQVTSPIRRITDLINLVLFQQHCMPTTDYSFSPGATSFCNAWLNHIDDINSDMRAIRRLQADCELLQACTEEKQLVGQQFACCVFDREEVQNPEETSGVMIWYRYQVYVPALKLCTSCRSPLFLANYESEKVKCELYLFVDEVRLKRKIRVALVQVA